MEERATTACPWRKGELLNERPQQNTSRMACAARITVRLNGKLIHDDVRLSLRRNKYAAYPEEPLSPIVLQEHGSPVKFRNIWLVRNTPNK